MWSKRVEVFPAKHTSSTFVAKALLTEVISRSGIPTKIGSDNVSHFVNSALTEVGQFLGIDMTRHCAHHPASGRAAERENGSLTNELAKCCEDSGLSWPKALPTASTQMRMRQRHRTNLSPFEISFGKPPCLRVAPPTRPPSSTEHCDDSILIYCKNLLSVLSQASSQAKASLPIHAFGPLHNIFLLTTHTAVKIAERATRIHTSHCRKVPAQPDTVAWSPISGSS